MNALKSPLLGSYSHSDADAAATCLRFNRRFAFSAAHLRCVLGMLSFLSDLSVVAVVRRIALPLSCSGLFGLAQADGAKRICERSLWQVWRDRATHAHRGESNRNQQRSRMHVSGTHTASKQARSMQLDRCRSRERGCRQQQCACSELTICALLSVVCSRCL